MKWLCVLVLAGLIGSSLDNGSEPGFAQLKGPYLGQNPPGKKAELFAPGLIGAGGNENNIAFSPDGMEVCFSFSSGGGRGLAKPTGVFRRGFMMYSRMEKGRWIEAKEFSFSRARQDHYPFFSPDGEKLLFNSNRKAPSNPDQSYAGIWYIERTEGGWSKPKAIGFPKDFQAKDYLGGKGIYPTVAANGNLYFALWPTNENGYIYMSKYDNGSYSLPERLSDAINDRGGNHPYIAPDESYIIFDDDRTENSCGELDLFISFRDKNGKWMKAKNMSERVNSPYSERRPFVSFDGKYLFFASDRINPHLPDETMTLRELRKLTSVYANGFQHIYWMSADIIRELEKGTGDEASTEDR